MTPVLPEQVARYRPVSAPHKARPVAHAPRSHLRISAEKAANQCVGATKVFLHCGAHKTGPTDEHTLHESLHDELPGSKESFDSRSQSGSVTESSGRQGTNHQSAPGADSLCTGHRGGLVTA